MKDLDYKFNEQAHRVALQIFRDAINALENTRLVATVDTWHDVTDFEYGWVNYGFNYAPAGYTVDSDGYVHLQGAVKSGSVGDTIFTLPEACRPRYNHSFAVDSNNLLGVCDVLKEGFVVASAGNNTHFALDGVIYEARG